MVQAMSVVILSSVAAGIGTIGITGINGLIFGTIVMYNCRTYQFIT
jgi:hypothetical protein